MNTIEIVKDALKYPLSDWKKILILGIIIVFSGIVSTAFILDISNMDIIVLLTGIGFIIGFLVNGYMFKIIKSSLNGKVGLPGFNNWIDMGADGAKVFIVFIIYLILPILVILFLAPLTYDEPFLSLSDFVSFFGGVGATPLETFANLIGSIIWPQIMNFIYLLYFNIPTVRGGFFALIYITIIIPIFLVAIANMAYYGGNLNSAFKLSEIIEEITLIGWINLIKWYILTGIIILFIEFVLTLIANISFYLIHLNILGETILGLLFMLTLIPYFYIFVARSVALFYMPDKEE